MGLFGFGKKTTVYTTFVNAADGLLICAAHMPPERLPDTFAVETTFHLVEQNWSVVSAVPPEKAEFVKTGKLTIKLSRLVMMPTQDINYTLPTISDDCGPVAGDMLPGPEVLSIHEDNWRQVEFVSRKFDMEIEAEIGDIRRVRAESGKEMDLGDGRKSMGFTALHVRKRIPAPLEGCGLEQGDFEAVLPVRARFAGVGFLRTRGLVPRGFAWTTENGVPVWGMADEAGKAAIFCLEWWPGEASLPGLATALAQFSAEQGLCVVNWCRVAVLRNESDFAGYFQGG